MTNWNKLSLSEKIRFADNEGLSSLRQAMMVREWYFYIIREAAKWVYNEKPDSSFWCHVGNNWSIEGEVEWDYDEIRDEPIATIEGVAEFSVNVDQDEPTTRFEFTYANGQISIDNSKHE
jgi:hypothetical protein